MKFGILAVVSLLLSAQAFAGEVSSPKAGDIVVTVEEAGKTTAMLSLSIGDQPKDSKLSITSEGASSTIYDSAHGLVTVKGQCTLEARQQQKVVWQLKVTDGVVKIKTKTPSQSKPAQPQAGKQNTK